MTPRRREAKKLRKQKRGVLRDKQMQECQDRLYPLQSEEQVYLRYMAKVREIEADMVDSEIEIEDPGVLSKRGVVGI